jgi:ABC-type Mn2+/Zn2+ transport system permease subunit
VGVGAVGAGLTLSYYIDTPAGPSIVLAAVVAFAGIYALAPAVSGD